MDIAAMNAVLDAAFGTTRAAHCPSSHTLSLYFGDPTDGGTELTSDGGYAAITVAAADWNAAADGAKMSDWLQFPTATDEWSSEATHWALLDGSDIWASGPVRDVLGDVPLVVSGAGPGPEFRAVVRFADSITPDE